MHRRSMWTELAYGGLGACLIVALGVLLAAPVRAAEPCDNPAAWLRPGEEPHAWKGAEARAMLRGLASLAPNVTQPPQWAAVAMVVAYAGPDDEVARVHVFDANACDVGPWVSIPVRVLVYVDNHMGTPA